MNNSLIPEYANRLPTGHPIVTYIEENLYLKNLLMQFSSMNFARDFQEAYNLFNQISRVEIRYTRKENQLFPYLEKRGWFGPSQGMWRFHDENRKLIKEARERIESRNLANIDQALKAMTDEILRLAQIEELRLFPMALDLLTAEDWEEMQAGETEIGCMHKSLFSNLPKTEKKINHLNREVDFLLKLSEGKMTLDQINLLFQIMPFDLTFVDENDRVAFYNRGEERVFPRSAGVIGREVRFCHPPKSVDTVLRILDEFKAGRKDLAEFWINFRGKVVHIRYFAVRDADKRYRGVIEVSQDITEIQKLSGEKRLLNWND
ncbi:MAG: DUF438 domain-containing protein [Bdellovibrio sp.]|nr:DUF438 domain-containing protein [Bdellovibrio sp.]